MKEFHKHYEKMKLEDKSVCYSDHDEAVEKVKELLDKLPEDVEIVEYGRGLDGCTASIKEAKTIMDKYLEGLKNGSEFDVNLEVIPIEKTGEVIGEVIDIYLKHYSNVGIPEADLTILTIC